MISLDEGNPKHRAFARLAIAQRDIGAAQRALSYIEKLNPSQDVYEMLITAAAIQYSRPFIATKAYRGIPGKFARFANPAFQTFHEEMILCRNQFVAHCDSRVVKVEIVPKGTEFRGRDGSLFTVYRHGTKVTTRVFRRDGLLLFKSVCAFQLERLREDINSLSHQLFPAQS